MLVSFNSVSFGYQGGAVLKDVTFAVNEGERIGLIGENGAGKTTLLNLMCGKLSAEGGSVQVKGGARIGFLEQSGGLDDEGTVYSQTLEAVKPQLDAVERLSALSEKLSAAEYGGREYAALSSRYESLNRYIAAHDCYNAEVRVKTVLGGMGFADSYEQKVATMSGGEKTRLRLARLLLEEPDLLILDEPTNHLDIKTLFWLEDYLSVFKGAVITVSHDRYFLDRTAARILEIENKKLYSYHGNYTKYKALKAERVALEVKEYERQQEERARLQDYVDRNIARATTAKSAPSRVKQLDRMEILEKPYVPPAPPRFGFTFSERAAETVIEVKDLNLEAGGKRLVTGGSLTVKRGQKVALVGENGAGKSTLLKHIFKNCDGAVSLGRYVRAAFYDQENSNLNMNNTVLAELWERHVSSSQTDMRAALARCGLCAEDAVKRVGDLSGGERAKLALCVLAAEEGNLLLLDEPTNHLDLPARESLESALKNFEGTVLFVSHDRYFIAAVAERIAEIEGGRLSVYDGGYEAYREGKRSLAAEVEAEREKRARAEYEEGRKDAFRSRRQRAEEAAARARIKQLERDISSAETEEGEIESRLSDPGVTADYREVERLCRRLEELKKIQEELYSEYEKLI